MFEHLPPLPSAQVPGLTNLQDGYLGHAPLVSLGPGRSRYLVPEGPIDVNYEPIRQRPLLAGRAVAVLKQGAHSFEGFSVVEPRGDTSASGPFVPVEGLFTLNDLMSSGTCGMAGAFAFLCGASDGQTLVVSKRSEDGTWTVAYRDVVAGRSLCLSMESPERLWMVKVQGDIDRRVQRKSTLQEVALVKGKLKATKLKVAFEDTVILAASAGPTFFYHDKTHHKIHVYDSGVKTDELDVPGGSMIFRYASAPDRFVIHGILTAPGGDAFVMGFRRQAGTFARWFEHAMPRMDRLAVAGDSVWHSGPGYSVHQADLP